MKDYDWDSKIEEARLADIDYTIHINKAKQICSELENHYLKICENLSKPTTNQYFVRFEYSSFFDSSPVWERSAIISIEKIETISDVSQCIESTILKNRDLLYVTKILELSKL